MPPRSGAREIGAGAAEGGRAAAVVLVIAAAAAGRADDMQTRGACDSNRNGSYES